LDLANPQTREKIAEVLAKCVELANRDDELVLTVSPAGVREQLESNRKQQMKNLRDREPEVAGDEGAQGDNAPGTTSRSLLEAFEVRHAASTVVAHAVGGFSGGYDRDEEQQVEQKEEDTRKMTAEDEEQHSENDETGTANPSRAPIFHEQRREAAATRVRLTLA